MTKAKNKPADKTKKTKSTAKRRRRAKAKAPQVFNVDKYLNNLVAPVFEARATAAKLAADVGQKPAELAETVRVRLEESQDLLGDEFRGLLDRLAESAAYRFVDETAADSQKRAREQLDTALARVGLMRVAEHRSLIEAHEKKAQRSKKAALSRQKKRLAKGVDAE